MGHSNKIHIIGLPSSITEDSVRQIFGKYGDIKLVYITDAKPPHTSVFVVYQNADEAELAIKELAYSKINIDDESVTIKVTYGDEETLRIIQKGEFRLIVEGFEGEVPESDIFHSFSECGDVVYCTTPLSNTNKAVGICLVTCRTKADAEKIVEKADQSTISGIKITVRIAPEQFQI